MKKYVIFTMLLVLLLCGCAKEEEIDPDAVNFAEMPTISIEKVDMLPNLNAERKGAEASPQILTTTGDGMFILKLNDGSDDKTFLHFSDFSSGETYPICAKPNCTHDDYLCSAYLTHVSHLHYDGSYIYYFNNDTQLWRMNTDGTDRRMLFQCNENAESGALMNIGGVVFLDGKVYFNIFGAMMNPETMEIESGEHICVADLESGKLTILPVNFQENKGSSTLNLLGMYDDLLVVRHSNIISSGFNYQKNEETVCLLDVNTLEVTVLHQWQWDTNESGAGVSFVTESIDEGYMIFNIYSDGYQHPTYADGTVEAVWPGDRLFIDLSQKKAYRMMNQDALSLEEIVVDGKWIYLRWNDDHKLVEKIVQDLTTGEVTLLPDAVREINFNFSVQSVGDYYIVGSSSEEGYITGRILKEDFWAGDREITPFPDWAIIV